MLYYNYLQGRYILELSGVRYTLKALILENAKIEARTLKKRVENEILKPKN